MSWTAQQLEAYPQTDQGPVPWSYEQAFARHSGLLTDAEQSKLRNSRVAIVGLGGVGGIHLATLARLGIGAFHIADPDTFELANFNRQYGANTRTLGRSKAEVMAELAMSINPEMDLRVFAEPVNEENVGEFLDGVDVVVDGIDFFAIEARRLVFGEAHRRGIWGVTAGPMGFSAAWMAFSPEGMNFDQYFDIKDGMDRWDQLAAFAVGLAPRPTHLNYLDLSRVDIQSESGPSLGLACNICSGVAATKVVKILLGRTPIQAAPVYFQFDAYRTILRKGRLRWGNRHPWQRLKRWYLRRRFEV
ncbi:MAG: ThiF family adenylyltransferase [Gemmataceae bacterium]